LRLGEGQLDFFDYGAAWGGNGQEGDNGLSLDGHQREVR
jgi:hypothetical protein